MPVGGGVCILVGRKQRVSSSYGNAIYITYFEQGIIT
jgi:hypothetical protein